MMSFKINKDRRTAHPAKWVLLSFAIVLASGIFCPGCASQEPVYSTDLEYNADDAKKLVPSDEKSDFARYEKERVLYATALQAYKNGDMQTVRRLRRNELANYPLSIYLDYSLLQLPEASLDSVVAFIKAGGHEILSNRLKAFHIKRLSAVNNYQGVLRISPDEPVTPALRCNWQQARYHTGHRESALKFIRDMYRRGEGLSAACGAFVTELRKNGVLTDEDTLERMLSAYWSRNGTKVYRNAAANLAKGRFANSVKLLGRYYENPSKYASVPANLGRTATAVFRRWARQNPLAAYSELESFKRTYNPSAREFEEIKETMAYSMLFEKDSVPMHFVDEVLSRSRKPQYLEQRFRRAVWDHDYRRVLDVTGHMPRERQHDDNFRYWKGRSLIETGRKDEGRTILNKLATERSFYGFYTAQTLGLPLMVNETMVKVTKNRSELIRTNSAYARYMEFTFLGDRFGMKTEWAETMKSASLEDARMIAAIESRTDDTLGVWETIYKKDWGALSLRFPLSYNDIYVREAQASGVPVSFMYGITRQESMMNHKAVSPVGARGLMQLMPGTASMVSRKHGFDYKSERDLLEPATNVRLGGAYLRDLMDNFNNNRIFVSAGYNAGPGRAIKWQSKDGRKRDAITYIESIPFTETRGYVQHVIFYDYIYQYLQRAKHPVFMTAEELSYSY